MDKPSELLSEWLKRQQPSPNHLDPGNWRLCLGTSDRDDLVRRVEALEAVIIAAYEDDCFVGEQAGALKVMPGLATYLEDGCNCETPQQHLRGGCEDFETP